MSTMRSWTFRQAPQVMAARWLVGQPELRPREGSQRQGKISNTGEKSQKCPGGGGDVLETGRSPGGGGETWRRRRRVMKTGKKTQRGPGGCGQVPEAGERS